MYSFFSKFSLRWMMAISAVMVVIPLVLLIFQDSLATAGVFMLFAQIVNLLFALTLLTYASYERDSFGYRACALFLLFGYIVLMYNVLANMIFGGSFYSFSEKMTTLTIVGNYLLLFGWFCNIANLKSRFEFTWILLFGSTLMTVFLTSSESEQAINVFSILGAIFGLILLINVMVVGDRKRFLEDLEQRDENIDEGNADCEVAATVAETPLLPVIAEDEPATEEPLNSHMPFEKKKEMLIKLKELLDSDILTQEEFNVEKKKILNS